VRTQTASPQQELLRSNDASFKKALGYSIGLHVLLFIIFAVRAVIYPASDALNLEDAIRVDIVALPDKKSAELPPLPAPAAPEPPKKAPVEESKPQPKTPPKPEPVKVAPPVPEAPKVNLEKTKKDQAAALKRLEALERIERMQKAESAAKASESKPAKPAVTGDVQPGSVVKGNTVSQGNSLTGLQRDAHRGYLATVQQQVKRAWRLPQWMANANYSARVRIWVDSSGSVIKKQMIRSSGNPDFDERVMNSIEQAGALPAPPADLVNVLAVDGLDADFP
jgi:colicin import membrane protein